MSDIINYADPPQNTSTSQHKQPKHVEKKPKHQALTKDDIDINSEQNEIEERSGAQKGIPKILTAQIISIIGTILIIIGSILLSNSLEHENMSLAIIATVLTIAALVSTFTAQIIEIIGIVQTGNEEHFWMRIALIVIVLTILIPTIIGILLPAQQTAAEVIVRIFETLTFVFTLLGLRNIAFDRQDDELVTLGTRLVALAIITSVLNAISSAAIWFNMFTGIAAITSGILTIIMAIVYIVYLSRMNDLVNYN